MVKRGLFLLVLFFAVCVAAAPLWAGSRDVRLRSSQDLAKSFQDLRDTINRLVQANAAWAEQNRTMQQAVQGLKDRQQGMNKGAELMAKELADWDQKLKIKTASSKDPKDSVFENKLAELDQDIALKEGQLETKKKEQERIWGRLASVTAIEGNPGGIKDLPAYTAELKELNARLDESRAQKKQLEQKLNYWALLNAEPSISVPKLMIKRDALTKQRNRLGGQFSGNPRKPSSYQDAASQERIKKLDFEVKQLSQKRFDSLKLLQTIENQYNNDSPSARTSDEKKIQASIVDLKKDNKMLKEQLANLKFEMVSLDKRRAQLEQGLRLSK